MNARILLIFAICFVCTELLRALPFLLFRGRPMPPVLQYVGRFLPLAVMATMVIYCLRGIDFAEPSGFLPHLIAVAVTAGLHLWKRNTLLSIFGGTVCFMLLVQLVF